MMDTTLTIPPAVPRRGMRWYRQPPVAFRHSFADLASGLWPGSARSRAQTPGLAFDSGRSALRFALEQLAAIRPDRRRVVVPAYTCWSVAAAIEYAGLEPVCCDLDPRTLDFSPAALAECLRTPPLAVVPTHLLGIAPAAGARAADGTDAWLIEDAAQAGDPTGEPLAGCGLRLTSTDRGKPLSTAGGGFLQVMDPDLVATMAGAWARLPGPGRRAGIRAVMRALATRVLIHPRLFWLPAAIPALHVGETRYPAAIEPARLTICQRRLYARAKVALVGVLVTRQRHAAAYADAVSRLLVTPQPAATRAPGFAPYRFPVYLDRPWLALSAADRHRAGRVGIAPLYPRALMDLERIRCRPANAGRTAPGAEWIADHLVTLPTHTGIGQRERDDVLATLAALHGGTGGVEI